MSKISSNILHVICGRVLARDTFRMLRMMWKAEGVFSLYDLHNISGTGTKAIGYLLLGRLLVNLIEIQSIRLTCVVLVAQITCVLD
jgi:hypothetical protein